MIRGASRKVLIVVASLLFLYYFFSSSTSASAPKSSRVPLNKHRTILLMGESYLWNYVMKYVYERMSPEEAKVFEYEGYPRYTLYDMTENVILMPERDNNAYWNERLMILQAGLSDLEQVPGRTWEDFFDQLKYAVSLVQKRGGSITLWPIILKKTEQRQVDEWNEELKQFCKENDIQFLEDDLPRKFYEDYSMRTELYKHWGDRTLKIARDFLDGFDHNSTVAMRM